MRRAGTALYSERHCDGNSTEPGLSSSSDRGFPSSNACPNDTVAGRSGESRTNKKGRGVVEASTLSRPGCEIRYTKLSGSRKTSTSPFFEIVAERVRGMRKTQTKWVPQIQDIWSTLEAKPQRWACLANLECRKKSAFPEMSHLAIKSTSSTGGSNHLSNIHGIQASTSKRQSLK